MLTPTHPTTNPASILRQYNHLRTPCSPLPAALSQHIPTSPHATTNGGNNFVDIDRRAHAGSARKKHTCQCKVGKQAVYLSLGLVPKRTTTMRKKQGRCILSGAKKKHKNRINTRNRMGQNRRPHSRYPKNVHESKRIKKKGGGRTLERT